MNAMTQGIRPVSCKVSQAPEVLGVSKDTIYRMQKEKKLKIHKVGSTSLVIIDEFLEAIQAAAE